MYDIPVTAEQGRSKLRQEFLKNKHVRDIRSIDLLVIKASGPRELSSSSMLFVQERSFSPHCLWLEVACICKSQLVGATA